jgi:aspartate carbamoyltransferase catalytic subunit
MKWDLEDVISINDFSRNDIEVILNEAKKMNSLSREKKSLILKNKVIASLFFEPSTRTRLSFETAIQNLGARVIGFSDAGVSSTKKGETLSDSIRTVENYVDGIVMRHKIEGAARRAAEVASVPVINGGDGANQHPTQTLLDLFTIKEEFGSIDGIKIALVGDLKYGRTVHSLALALNKFKGCELYFVAPDQLKMPSEIKEKLANSKVIQTEDLTSIVKKVDIIYSTRIQKERFADELEYNKVKDSYILTKETIKDAKKIMRIMHPLPRVNELSEELDTTIHALYFKQAGNGIPVREAILKLLIGGIK